MGRQPGAVFGLMTTASGVSASVSIGAVITSMTVFTLLYGALAVVVRDLEVSAPVKALLTLTPVAASDAIAPLVDAMRAQARAAAAAQRTRTLLGLEPAVQHEFSPRCRMPGAPAPHAARSTRRRPHRHPDRCGWTA